MARARARYGSALLSLVAVLAGCASEERLSLGQHHLPVPSGPAFTEGAAGGMAPGAGSQAVPVDPDLSQAGAPPVPHRPFERPSAPQPPPDASSAEPTVDAAVQGITCAPGTYAAELACAVDPSMLPPRSDPRASSPMQAEVTFAVEPGRTSEQLEIRGGTLRFQYMGAAFEGRLEGGLDCASSAFHADIVDGSYAAQYPGAPMPGQFEGAIDGMLDPSAPLLSGMWWHSPANVPEGFPKPSCVGPWTARLQEP
jgi:hypothetical protein